MRKLFLLMAALGLLSLACAAAAPLVLAPPDRDLRPQLIVGCKDAGGVVIQVWTRASAERSGRVAMLDYTETLGDAALFDIALWDDEEGRYWAILCIVQNYQATP